MPPEDQESNEEELEDQDSGNETDGDQKGERDTRTDWEKFLEEQPDEIQALYAEDVKGLKSALKAERADSRKLAQLEAKVSDFEKAQKELEDKELSKSEKLQKELDQLKEARDAADQELRVERVKAAVLKAAIALNFRDPEDAYSMIDVSQLELSDDGSIEDLDDQLKDLLSLKPYLKKGKGDGKGNPSRGDKQKRGQKVKTPEPTVHF